MMHLTVSAKLFPLAVILYLTCSVESVARGAVRFYRNGSPTLTQAWSSGIVQIYYSGSWGNICDDLDFGSTEADVVCHQFGYSGASSNTNTGISSLYGSDSSSTLLDDVSCISSSYLAITQCSFSTIISSFSCNNNNDVIVTCYSTRIWSSPSTGDIRLTGGTYSNQGLLEVYCNGEWGTVCDDTFSFTEARVSCRQLGYNDYFNYEHLSQQGSSSQSIWLDSLSGCSSTSDTCLTSCQACPVSEDHNCFHSEDVTLECEYDSFYSKATTTTSTYCSYSDSDISSASAGVIAGAVIATIVGLIICIAIFTVPFCICCCLGVGIGAASRSRPRTTVVTGSAAPATTAAVVTTTQETSTEQKTAYPYQAPPPAYTQDPTQAAYPGQVYPPQGYPPQGYPPQGYQPPPQGYPAEGYAYKQ